MRAEEEKVARVRAKNLLKLQLIRAQPLSARVRIMKVILIRDQH